MEQVDSHRDKTIISLFADSGMRLAEMAKIRPCGIDWSNCTITVWGKGNKQRKAPFTEKAAQLLRELVAHNGAGENIWHMKPRGIQNMLLELAKKTGLPCNPHTFRRTFASNLHRAYYAVGWLGEPGHGYQICEVSQLRGQLEVL